MILSALIYTIGLYTLVGKAPLKLYRLQRYCQSKPSFGLSERSNLLAFGLVRPLSTRLYVEYSHPVLLGTWHLLISQLRQLPNAHEKKQQPYLDKVRFTPAVANSAHFVPSWSGMVNSKKCFWRSKRRNIRSCMRDGLRSRRSHRY